MAGSKAARFRQNVADAGQTDEAQAHSNLAEGLKSAADLKRIEEQRAWDEHNLKTELRRRLTDFIAMAESLDLAAPTQRRAGKMVFWKLLYRLGKQPTLAAVAVARE